MRKPVSRREFLNALGATGGTAAALNAASALGLLPASVQAASLDLFSPAEPGNKIAILGGGISGLTVAYELSKVGYDCTVLEASYRCGGRIFTVRNGTLIDEIGNRQYCEFDTEPHMYFNAGAARIPSTHRNLLAYCKELDVELEIFINENKTAYFQDDALLGGSPIRNAEYTTNIRGFLAEIMSKSFSNQELDEPFSEREAETLLSMIRSFGDLDENDLYQGSLRAGYASGGFIEEGVQKDMINFRDLLQSRRGQMLLSENEGETGPMLLQPVGGMDKIIDGFLNKIGDNVRYNAMVTSVQIKNEGVEIAYDQNDNSHSLEADYCFNCIPTHLMVGIDHNFPSEYVDAMKYIRRGDAYKASFQAKERFWEKEDIYGGISWMANKSNQLWYPSHGIHKNKGIILAAYDYAGSNNFTEMRQEERIETHLADGEKVHSDYRNLVEKPITIAWHRMNHMLGCSARFARSFSGWTHEEEEMFHTLQTPVNGRHYFIGDQITKHTAWQESAILSAQWALADMDNRARSENA